LLIKLDVSLVFARIVVSDGVLSCVEPDCNRCDAKARQDRL
jgi:hypothetical protein